MGEKNHKSKKQVSENTRKFSVLYYVSFCFFYWTVIFFIQILKLDTNRMVGQCGYPAGQQG